MRDAAISCGVLAALALAAAIQGAAHKRLAVELKSDFNGEKWLLGAAKAGNWWLRAERLNADKILERLGILDSSPLAYYRDIFIWLPDVRWGAMPPCPCCYIFR